MGSPHRESGEDPRFQKNSKEKEDEKQNEEVNVDKMDEEQRVI